MNISDHIITKQIEWAHNRGIELTGSQGNRGLKVYTTSIIENLFKPLSEQAKKDLKKGDGGELDGAADKPAKIQALHSSSALGINMFDYWRESPDLSLLTSSCGLSRAGTQLKGDIRFEQKFSIDDRFKYAPNVDVVIYINGGRFKTFAVECKFTEAYSSRVHGGFDDKYFKNDDIWPGLSATKKLAKSISPDDTSFHYLHPAQLIKHILGLNRKLGHARYRLLYLWYDAFGEPGFKHRQEVDQFADIVRSDGVIFHSITYQELIARLAQYRDKHSKYVEYITDRYI